MKITDASKSVFALSWKKKTLKLVLNGIPESQLNLSDGVTVSIDMDKVRASLSSTAFFSNAKGTKATLAAEAGELMLSTENSPCH